MSPRPSPVLLCGAVALVVVSCPGIGGANAARAPKLDTRPPSTPRNLVVGSAGPTSLSLSWRASTDNVAVAGYKVYVNGVLVGTAAP